MENGQCTFLDLMFTFSDQVFNASYSYVIFFMSWVACGSSVITAFVSGHCHKWFC